MADQVAKGKKALKIDGKNIKRGDFITQEWLAFIRRMRFFNNAGNNGLR